MKNFHLLRIYFSRNKKTLEEIVRLIYLDKTTYSLQSEKLKKVILLLRKHKKSIRDIGYNEDNPYYISVYLKLDDKEISKEELDFLRSLSF